MWLSVYLCVQNADTFFGIGHKENMFTVSDFKTGFYLLPSIFLKVQWVNKFLTECGKMTMGKSLHQLHRWLSYVTCRSASYPEDGHAQQEHVEVPTVETGTHERQITTRSNSDE